MQANQLNFKNKAKKALLSQKGELPNHNFQDSSLDHQSFEQLQNLQNGHLFLKSSLYLQTSQNQFADKLLIRTIFCQNPTVFFPILYQILLFCATKLFINKYFSVKINNY